MLPFKIVLTYARNAIVTICSHTIRFTIAKGSSIMVVDLNKTLTSLLISLDDLDNSLPDLYQTTQFKLKDVDIN